jgi:hypothetical protein
MSTEVYTTGDGEEDENESFMAIYEGTIPVTTIHDGVTLKSTVKDGFRVDTITIRMDDPADAQPAPYDYRRRLDELFKAGQDSCDSYNQQLGYSGDNP